MTDRVCIIGSGSSGIASCRVLHARGIPYGCLRSVHVSAVEAPGPFSAAVRDFLA